MFCKRHLLGSGNAALLLWNYVLSHFTEKYIPEVRDLFRDLLPFVQFKKRENYPWRSVTFFNIPGWSQQFSKSNISPFVFFHVFKIKLMLPNCAKHYSACQCKQDFTSLKHAVVVFKLFNFNSNLSQLFQYLCISKFICSNSGKEWHEYYKQVICYDSVLQHVYYLKGHEHKYLWNMKTCAASCFN